jgi:hypothetical protein
MRSGFCIRSSIPRWTICAGGQFPVKQKLGKGDTSVLFEAKPDMPDDPQYPVIFTNREMDDGAA